MTLAEALDAVRLASARLVLDDQGPLLRGRVPDDVVAVLKANRDRVTAALRLRELHRAARFDEGDVLMIEEAMLNGTLTEVVFVVAPPAGSRPA